MGFREVNDDGYGRKANVVLRDHGYDVKNDSQNTERSWIKENLWPQILGNEKCTM